MKKIFLLTIIIFFLTTINIYAHSGNTDANGGHYDYSTGEYHYHHGYSAHQHINGLCPYISNFEAFLPNICPNCNNIVVPENGNYCFECGYELLSPSIKLKLVSGISDKTREEYFNEVQGLKNEIDKKEEVIDTLNNDIKEKESEISFLKEEHNNNTSNLWFYFILIFTIGIIISYNFGKTRRD